MKQLLRRILKFLAYTGAGSVIVLAIAVGLFRLLLPKLPEYQEDIKRWADQAIGMQVEFSAMNARWRLSGPELNFYDAALTLAGSDEPLIEASEISVGVGLIRLLLDRKLVVDRIVVQGTTLDLQHSLDGDLLIQGMTIEDLAALVPVRTEKAGDMEFIGQDITIRYQREAGQAQSFRIGLVEISRDEDELRIEASLDLPDDFGNRLDISASQRIGDGQGKTIWQVFVDGRSLELPSWSRLGLLDMATIASGRADISLWMELTNAGLDKATANLAIDDLSVDGTHQGIPFDVEGRIEYSRDDDGWLLAAENFRMRTVDNEWPASSIQIQVSPGEDENTVAAIVANASYVRFDDLRYLLPWLPEETRALYERFSPTGELRELRADIVGLGSEQYRFNVSVQLTDAGMTGSDKLPGIRGFTGSLRANRTGGRLEFDSSNLRIDVPQYVSETLVFDDVMGTVIWRRSSDGIIILSDSVRLRNADFDSQSSLQVRIPADGSAPVVDFESRWSINDIASVKRFLPGEIMSPALYRWLNDALVSGVVTKGTTVLTGPLDKFPFDNGEGRFRVDAHLENAILKYHKSWPAAELRSLDLVVDGTHLLSDRNIAINAGNKIANARIEILDLRDPVLTIDAFATGTLASIRDFSRRSPIAAVFGGQLDNVQVSGDASFHLSLRYPMRDRDDYEFTTRIQSSGGSISVAGFPAAVTNLNGIVTITRDSISSESLFGQFLGQQVDIEVTNAGEDMPSNSVVVSVTGTVTAAGLSEELGVPLGDMVSGSSEYRANLLFPRAGLTEPAPLQIAISSNLVGIGIDLPAPLTKASEEVRPLAALIEFVAAGHIASHGSLGDDLKWSMDFRADSAGWDFDRGALSVGGGYPDLPETRGMHILGQTDEIRLHEWLSIAGTEGDAGSVRIGDRIRSIDLAIDNLYLFGQHLQDHRVIVDRGADEWLVQVEGAQVDGSVTIPYNLPGDRPIVLDMNVLTLPGSDEPGGVADHLDPRTLAAISIKASEFALGNRHLGAVEAEFKRTADGLRATGLTVTDESFSIVADAGWVVDSQTEAGQSSYLTGKLKSRNVMETMRRLDYTPGIDSDDMEMDIEVSWPGGPREDFLDDLEGEVVVRFGAGQLIEVEPGAGRIFGLMSVVALPRRLALDFSDVLEKGFGFDAILGTFHIENGNAYTCNLSLDSPAADIGIAGRVGLATRDYEQTAIVSANVGNTLPLVGVVVAGPQVAAALLIFSQIFKKPLQEMGQIYYGIEGSFDDPEVEVTNEARFAASLELAGCSATQE